MTQGVESLTSLLVKEQRRNGAHNKLSDDTPHWIKETKPLLSALAWQTPNRIYVGEDGTMLQVALYKDIVQNLQFNAYFQVLKMGEKPLEWNIEATEEIVGFDERAIEEQIRFVRGKFRLRKDLWAKPDWIEKITTPDNFNSGNLVHFVKTDTTTVACQYYLSPFGPRVVEYSHDIHTNGFTQDSTVLLPDAPREVLEHQNLFDKK